MRVITVPIPARNPTVEANSQQGSWYALNEGHYARAFQSFAHHAANNPEAGAPKLGYALAAALRGDDLTAAYAMRRVYAYEEKTLDKHHAISTDIIDKLIKRYEYQDNEDGRLMHRALTRLQISQKHQHHRDAVDTDEYPSER